MLQQAVAHHQAGQLAQAEALYRQALQAFPEHPDALRLLGLIALQVGQFAMALPLLEKAIQSGLDLRRPTRIAGMLCISFSSTRRR